MTTSQRLSTIIASAWLAVIAPPSAGADPVGWDQMSASDPAHSRGDDGGSHGNDRNGSGDGRWDLRWTDDGNRDWGGEGQGDRIVFRLPPDGSVHFSANLGDRHDSWDGRGDDSVLIGGGSDGGDGGGDFSRRSDERLRSRRGRIPP